MDNLSIEGFHTQLDCKLAYSNKNQTQQTLVQHNVLCSKTKQSNAEQNKNDEKYSQTGIIVKIHTNHDGVSNCDHVEIHHSYLIIVISSHHSKDSLRNYISLCSSEQRACFNILSNVLSGKSHQSKKASFECCHHKQPSCSHEFSCRLFTKHKP